MAHRGCHLVTYVAAGCQVGRVPDGLLAGREPPAVARTVVAWKPVKDPDGADAE